METKKPASIKAHQRFGALRIGTLRDHESVALLVCLDACLRCNVARNRKLPNSSQYPNIWLPTKTSEFRRDICLSQATPLRDVESSRLPGKNYESLLSRARLLVCFQSPFWQSTCLIP